MAFDFEKVLLSIVSDKSLVPIGKVITAWAWTEALLDQAIWRLLGVSHRKGRAVTSAIQVAGKIDMLDALMNLSRRDRSKLSHLLKEGKHLSAQRNLVAHGYVVTDDSETSEVRFISFHARGALTERSRRADPEIIDELARRICRFNEFLLDFHDLLPISPAKRKRPTSRGVDTRRRRMKTIAKQILPPLGWSNEELEKARQMALPIKHGKQREKQ
jgi:hypothetical protein